ncbi:MAG: hypothetical protein GXP06_09620 [Alphaproteobacteria bacterium]|nr:hypothetical protein [Alphaproteobacteria bacterium]
MVQTPVRAEDWIDALMGDEFAIMAGLGVVTVSVFRGVKSIKLNPSVYGFIEIERGDIYGGMVTTPSSIAGEIRPFVLGYGGYAPSVGAFDFNIGARYYAFPASSPFDFDLDADGVIDHSGRKGFYEGFAGATREFGKLQVRARAFYAPNVFGETGGAAYANARVRAPIAHGFDVRADFGVSAFERSQFNDDYVDYSVGIFKTLHGFDMFVRYSDTSGLAGSDDRVVVFGIEKAWSLAEDAAKHSYLRRKIRNRHWGADNAVFRNNR